MLNAGYPETDPVVDAGIQYILGHVHTDPLGSHPVGTVFTEAHRYTYHTSIAILPLVATHNSAHHTIIGLMRNWLISAQWDDISSVGNVQPGDWQWGGFGYGNSNRPDLSNTQFALLALKAADWELDLDAADPPDDTYNKALTYLDFCRNPVDGGSSYCDNYHFDSIHTMTAASVWSYALCGLQVGDQPVDDGIDWLATNYSLNNDDGWGEQSDYYYRMTLAKALVMTGTLALDGHDWYTELVDLLDAPPPARGGQLADGSWPGPAWLPGDAGVELNTAWAILAIQTRELTPWVDLELAFVLASHADLHVYDPEDRHVGMNYATQSLDLQIPGATFQLIGGRQVVNLPQLVAGSYRVELVGTSNGYFELTVNGIQNGQELPSHSWAGDIRTGEYLGTDVTVTAMVGPLTLLYGDLVVLPVPPIPTVSEWGLIVLALLLLIGGKIYFGRRHSMTEGV